MPAFDNRTHTSDVKAQGDEAIANGISSAPTFVINGQPVVTPTTTRSNRRSKTSSPGRKFESGQCDPVNDRAGYNPGRRSSSVSDLLFVPEADSERRPEPGDWCFVVADGAILLAQSANAEPVHSIPKFADLRIGPDDCAVLNFIGS